MRSQLLDLGVSDKKIIRFSELQNHPELKLKDQSAMVLGSAVRFCDFIESINKHDCILMLTGNLDFNGASIAFINAAVALKKNGFNVLLVSAGDGKLAGILRDNDINVIIDPNILYKTCNELQWTCEFEYIICNTLLFYKFLSDVKSQIKILWWLHDPEILYSSLNKDTLSCVSGNGLNVYAVGPVAAKAIKAFHPEYDVKTLLYGIPEMQLAKKNNSEKLEMAVIANVQAYKGQDLVVDAIKYLSDDELNKIHIRIIGNQNSYYASELHKKASGIEAIEFVPEMERDGIENVYSEIDILLCPSRVDCMPVSVAEAMQNSIPSIVSDSVGTAMYISDCENGIVFKANNSEDLADKIRWCIEDNLFEIGNKAREIYNEYFSLEVFERNLMDAVQNSFFECD